jgi:hypothetical protein
MATLTEINTLLNDPVLGEKVGAACLITAKNIAFEGGEVENHANRLKFAAKIFADPQGIRVKVTRYVIAANSAESLAAINALSDSTIQSHVDASVNIFADGS